MKPWSPTRRSLLKAGATTAAAIAAPGAFAQAYPARPIRLICPWTAGGSIDGVMRAMGLSLGRILGTTVLVDNKPGASGTLGVIELVNARPEGYTLSQIPPATFSLPNMQKVQFDQLKDITYIAGLAGSTNGLVARTDSPIKSIKDLVDFAKANPGGYTYSSPGVGTFAQLAAEDFAFKAGIKLRHIPYKGDADGLQALLAGHVMALSSSTSWASQVDSGACRLLASYGSKRIKRWAASPTLRELGFNTIPESPFGIGAPKGMDPALVARLQDAFKLTLEDPLVVAVLDKYDMPVHYMGAADYTRWSQDAFDSHKAMITRLGLAAT